MGSCRMSHKVLASVIGAVVLAVAGAAGISEASPMVSGYASGDDNLWIWGYDGDGNWGGGVWWPAGGATDYRSPSYIFSSPGLGNTVDIYFAVSNVIEPIPDSTHLYPAGPDNPAGFLASFSASSGIFAETGTNRFGTDADHWEIVAHEGWARDPAFDPTGLTGWTPPTAYGANGVHTIWYYCNGEQPVQNIDPGAQWIWTGNNCNDRMDNYVVLHARYTVTPEPATYALFGIGAVAIAFRQWRKKRANAPIAGIDETGRFSR